MARPPLEVSDEKQQRICEALRVGANLTHAAQRADISKRTLQRWILRGKTEESGACWQLYQQVQKARSDLVVALLLRIHQAGVRDWRAAAWQLERVCPDVYGKPPVKTQVVSSEVSDEEVLDDAALLAD